MTTPATVEPASELVIISEKPGGAILANFAALKAHIDGIIADYRDVTVTPGTVKAAKKDRAYLNSLSASLNQKRKDVKARYMAPVVAFEEMVKELDAPIREASDAIDVQVKEFEAAAKVEKRERLKAHYEEFAPALVDAVPFERIEDPKWMLASTDLMKGFEEIEARVERIATDEATLSDLNLNHPVEAKAEYFATLYMGRAIARSKALDKQVAAAARLEAQKAEWEAQQACEAPAPTSEPIQAAPEPAPTPEPTTEYTIVLTCTRTQLDGVIADMKARGLRGVVRS